MNAPKLPIRAEAGVVIGGYELVRRIGRGGMAEVWVARRALGQKGTKFVAIKLIADHYVGDERYARMFRAEAELAAVLSHTNIVQVFDEGEDSGRSYLIMEWVDGLNLLKLGAVLALLDDDDRRFRVTSYIIGQLLYALAYAHSITSFDGSPLGVVHRDVSPQNVLVSNHGEVKLTDFGVAYYTMEESSGIHVKGKVRYMAPEQLAGKTRHPTVDLFAVGALLHELLDGKKFRGDYENGQEMFTAVLAGTVPPLTRSAPPELDELRLRLLAPDPSDRIQTAEDAVEWLKRFPGHGDARSDLTKLCGSLTGVVRPRAGPGQSSQVPMADRRTGQYGGYKGQKLAKPRVSLPGAKKAPPRPPSAPTASAASIRTTVPLEKRAASTPPPPPRTTPLVTGQTELVDPRALSQLVGTRPRTPSSPPPPHVRPTAFPAANSNPNPTSAIAATSSPIPTHVPPHASNPIPIPIPVASSHPNPIDARVGSSSPRHHGPPHSVPPTERLHASETSGAGPHASEISGAGGYYGTELVDAYHLGSDGGPPAGTDHDVVPMRVEGDGTDTSRDVRHPHPTRSQPTIAIALPQKSAVALIVIGLLLIASVSASITWYLVIQRDEPTSTNDAESRDDAAAPAEPVEPVREEPEDAAEERPEPEPAAPPPPPSDETDERGDDPGTNDHEEASPIDAPGPDPAATEGHPAPKPETTEVDPPKPEPKKPRLAKATLRIKPMHGTDGYQLKIGNRIVDVKSRSFDITSGRRPLSWRKGPNEEWTKADPLVLKSGGSATLIVATNKVRQL